MGREVVRVEETEEEASHVDAWLWRSTAAELLPREQD